MNLSNNPTEAQLVALLAACDDKAADHVLWVSEEGEVSLTPLSVGESPARFIETTPGLCFCHETYPAGEGGVGSAASRKGDYVSLLYCDLRDAWRRGRRGYLGR
jgi:hypothetical protein